MADTPDPLIPVPPPQKEPSGLTPLLIIVVFLLLGGAFFLVKIPAGQKLIGLQPIGTPQKQEAKPLPSTPGFYITVPDLLINLKTEESKGHFLKLCLTLEFKNQKDANYVTQIMPKIVDNFQVYLSELRVEDLKGAEGIYGLKQHLLARVNAEIAPLEATEVLFRDMLVQ